VGYLAGIGALEGGIATLFAAGEQNKRLSQLKDIANTPGIDFGALTSGALQGYQQNLGAATGLASQLSTANQKQLNAQQELALPGLGAARSAQLSQIQKLFGGGQDFQNEVQRLGGIAGVGSGLFGSGAGQLQSIYKGYQQQNADTALGSGLLSSLIGSLKLANTPGIQAFIGPDISQQLATRSNERTQRISGLTGAAMQPTGNELIYHHMQQEGASLEGLGLGGGGFGGGGGVGSNNSFNVSDYMQQRNMMNDYGGGGAFGSSDVGWALV
jgi:hypothetical protein